MLNSAFGMALTDNKSGFVLTEREIFEDLLSYRGTYHYWQSFIMVALTPRATPTSRSRPCSRRVAPARASSTTRRCGRSCAASSISGARSSSIGCARSRRRCCATSSMRPAAGAGGRDAAGRQLHWRGYVATFGLTHWMLTKEVDTHLRELRESQWLSVDKMRALQEEKLHQLVRHAYRHVPYYASA